MTQRVKPIVALTFAISLIAAACASSGDETAAPSSTTVAPTTTPAPTSTTAPTTTTTAAPTTTTTTTTTPKTTTTAAPDDGGGVDGFVEVTDETGILSLTVPASWTDVDGTGWAIDDQDAGPGLAVAPDIDEFLGTWTAPGVFFAITDDYPNEDEGWLLDTFRYPESCTLQIADTWNGTLSGPYEVWENCDGEENVRILLEVYPSSRDYIAILEIQVGSDADTAAVEQILASFKVAPHR